MKKHLILAIIIFSVLVVWNHDFSYGFLGAGLLGLFHLVTLSLLVILLWATLVQRRIKAVFILVIYLTAILFSTYISIKLEAFKIQNTEKRGKIIVSAIEEYRKDKGKYPDNLLKLTPKYLDAVPKTNMGILTSQSFLYRIDYDSNTYALLFFCPTFIIGEYSSKTGTWQYDD